MKHPAAAAALALVLLAATTSLDGPLGPQPANIGQALDSGAAACTASDYDRRDQDRDGIGDACDPDRDGDGLDNDAEEPLGADPQDPDTDDDNALDGADNCVRSPNPDQADADADGRGDVCDGPRGSRATWLWHCGSNLQPCMPNATDVVRFAVEKDLDAVFLSFPPKRIDQDDWYRAVIDGLQANGIHVYALSGRSEWFDDFQNVVDWYAYLLEVTTRADLGFEGLHIDLEPWTRDDWAGHEDAAAHEYLDILRYLSARAHERGWTLEVDIPFWLDQKPEIHGGLLHEEVLGIADAVTVATFRDTADEITRLAEQEMQAGARLEKPVRLAVSVKVHEFEYVTFMDDGEAVMERNLRWVDEDHTAAAAYAGVGIHPYDAYTTMAP